jgi:uncharacterized C2H2 Zn-finger protein
LLKEEWKRDEDERNNLKQELKTALENIKHEKDKVRETNESLKAITDDSNQCKDILKAVTVDLNNCKQEIDNYVEANTKLVVEVKTMKEIEATREKLAKKENPSETEKEPILIDDVENTNASEEESSDVSDEEAAEAFKQNKNTSARENVKISNKSDKETGAKPKRWECENCGFKANARVHLNSHRKQHEIGNQKNYRKCAKCLQLFQTVDLLSKHLIKMHGIENAARSQGQAGAKADSPNSAEGESRIKCDQCEYKAKTRDDLLEHLEVKHTQDFRCDVCHMKADSKMQLRKHKTVCNLKPKEVCPFWRKGMCRFDENSCRSSHPPQPKCRNQKNYLSIYLYFTFMQRYKAVQQGLSS